MGEKAQAPRPASARTTGPAAYLTTVFLQAKPFIGRAPWSQNGHEIQRGDRRPSCIGPLERPKSRSRLVSGTADRRPECHGRLRPNSGVQPSNRLRVRLGCGRAAAPDAAGEGRPQGRSGTHDGRIMCRFCLTHTAPVTGNLAHQRWSQDLPSTAAIIERLDRRSTPVTGSSLSSARSGSPLRHPCCYVRRRP